jgi:hypothetical protein
MDFKKAFRELNGYEPTTQKILEFERTCATLQTTSNDALLAVLLALDHYENLYAAVPRKIAASVGEALASLQTSMDAQAQASIAAVQIGLIEAVSIAADKTVEDAAKARKWKWLSMGMIAASTLTIGTAWYFHQMGRLDGYSLGYGIGHKVAMSEIATAAWANTDDGKLSYSLAMTTKIGDLATCSNAGWQIRNGVCYPMPDKDGNVTGWRIP